MPHKIKVAKNEVTISNARLIRHMDRRFGWTPERLELAVAAAKKRLGGKHPRKRDAATVLSATIVGKG